MSFAVVRLFFLRSKDYCLKSELLVLAVMRLLFRTPMRRRKKIRTLGLAVVGLLQPFIANCCASLARSAGQEEFSLSHCRRAIFYFTGSSRFLPHILWLKLTNTVTMFAETQAQEYATKIPPSNSKQ